MANFPSAKPSGGGPVSVGDLPAEAMLTTTYDPAMTGGVISAETIRDRLILKENVTAGQLVYLSSDALVAGVASGGVADKDTPTKRPAFACAITSGLTGETIDILQNGLADTDTSAFAVNDIVSLGNNGGIALKPKKSDQQIGIIRTVSVTGQMLMQQGSFNKTNIRNPNAGEIFSYDATDNELVSSGLVNQGPNKIKTSKEFFAKKLKTEPASIEIGEGVTLSNGGSEILQHSFSTTATEDHAFLPRKNIDFVLGTEGNFTTGRVIGAVAEVVLQGIDTLRSDDPSAAVGLNIISGKVTYPVTVTEDRLITKFFTRFDTIQTGIRFVIRIGNSFGPVIFVTNTDETWEDGEGFTSLIYTGSPATETVIDVSEAPLVALQGVTYHVTVESNVGDIVMLGDVVAGPEYSPYFRRDLQSLADDPVVSAHLIKETDSLVMGVNDWYTYVYMDATSGNKTVTLPSAVGPLGSALFATVIKTDASANTVTVLPFGGESIIGNAVINSQNESLTLTSDGVDSYVINKHPVAAGGGGDLLSTNNLSDVASASTSRTNLNVDVAGTDNSINVSLGGSPNDVTDDTLDLVGQVLTVNAVTVITDGAMLATDKVKLDNISAIDTWVSGLAVTEQSPADQTVDYTSGTYLIDGDMETIGAGGVYDLENGFGAVNHYSGLVTSQHALVLLYVDTANVIKSVSGPTAEGGDAVEPPAQPVDTVCIAFIEIKVNGSSVPKTILQKNITDCRGVRSINTDEFVKISSDDSATGHLSGKLSNNGNVSFTIENAGGDETLKAEADLFSGTSGVTGANEGVVPDDGVAASGRFLKDDGTWAAIGGGGDLLAVNNLSDVVSAATSLSNLGGEPSFTKNTAFNKNFGVIAGTVLEGDTTTITAGQASDITANNAKVTNATHTGDVTGDVALTIAAKAVDVAMLADGTDGELITWDAAGVASTVSVGTATHVLTSNGAGVAPTFQAAGGGSLTYTELFEDAGTRSAAGWGAIPVSTAHLNKIINVLIHNGSTGTRTVGVREAGSALARVETVTKDSNVTMVTKTDGSGDFEINSDSNSSVSFTILSTI